MFSELPKLLERNFVLGFFLPVAIFVSVSLFFLDRISIISVMLVLERDVLIGTTVLGLLTWLGSVVLLAINRDLLRVLEGYGKLNPIKLLKWWHLSRYRDLNKKLRILDDHYYQYNKRKAPFPLDKRIERNKLMRNLSENYPDDENWVLPTAFGNAVRAFEVYSRTMYGFEVIYGWSRMLSVVPEDYRALIDNAKSQVDFWVNLWAISILLIGEYFIIMFYGDAVFEWLIPFTMLLLAFFSSYRACQAAIEWGDMVKAAIDIYRFDLLEKLGFSRPKNNKEERVLWEKFSQAIVYRLPDILPEIKKSEKNKKQ